MKLISNPREEPQELHFDETRKLSSLLNDEQNRKVSRRALALRSLH